MKKIPFSKDELKVIYEIPNPFAPDVPPTPVYNTPVTPREAVLAAYNKEPIWQLSGSESAIFSPTVIPDDVARGFVIEAGMIPPEQFGGKDMFGIEWEYVPVVGGSMVRPGKPFLEDANEWKEKLVWPDINSWDWEGSAKANKEFLDNGLANFLWFLNGCWYERLVSFMEFENAIVALIDEEQKDAVKELFDKLTNLYCDIVDKCCETYGDSFVGFTVHDDWGSQRAPFFSPKVGEEMIVPYMKKLTDHIKSKGKIADLHSCGHLEAQCENFIKAGWQSWTPMSMNDTKMLYEKYGKDIMIYIVDSFTPEEAASEEGQRAHAVKYLENFAKPEKPSVISYIYGGEILTPAFRESLYKESRILFSK